MVMAVAVVIAMGITCNGHFRWNNYVTIKSKEANIELKKNAWK